MAACAAAIWSGVAFATSPLANSMARTVLSSSIFGSSPGASPT
jgi:hypothetical protein